MIAVPTIAFEMPPPAPPNKFGLAVRKCQLSEGAPFRTTETTTMMRTVTASSAASVPSDSMILFTIRRRRSLPPGRRSTCGLSALHLPPRRTERQRTFLELGRDAEEQLATDARDDRHDHDRQDHDRGEHAQAVLADLTREHRRPTERVVKPWVDVSGHERPEDE